jgi:hypothetical protein
MTGARSQEILASSTAQSLKTVPSSQGSLIVNKEDSLLGRYTIRTYWSGNGAQLVSAVLLHTKDERDAQVTIVRELSDAGKTLILRGTLKVVNEPEIWTLRRVWRRRTS